MPKREDEIRKKKRRSLIGTILLVIIFIFTFIFGMYSGFILGVRYTTETYVNVLALVFKSSDVKMTINMTLNQTEMMDYMLEKMGINNETITKKEYIPPCNMDPNVPRGETGTNRCIMPTLFQILRKEY